MLMKLYRALLIVCAFVVVGSEPACAGVPGPLKVSPNGRCFVDRDGKLFLWLGDTAWPLFAQYSRSHALDEG